MKKLLKALWHDSRRYSRRLLTAGVVMLAACFTFVFFGPLEMVAFSGSSLVYSYDQVALPLALAALGALTVGTLLLSLLRGKIFDWAVSLVLGLTLAGYLQAAFFNGSLGTLTGDAVDWAALRGQGLLELLLWLGCPAAVLVLKKGKKELWKKLLLYLPAVLVVMQLTSLVSIFLGAYEQPEESSDEYYLSQEGMAEYSSKKNIFVFVLDRLDYTYLEQAMDVDPDFLDGLDGFTSYTNAISVFARTKPALAYLLTGYGEEAYMVPVSQYYRDAWTAGGNNILADLQKKNFTVDLYAKTSYLFSDPDFADQYVDNFTYGRAGVKELTVVAKLMRLSAYRYGPTMLKPQFWADTNYYNSDVVQEQAAVYAFNDSAYAVQMAAGTAKQTANSFKLYHFFGPHAPYSMNADGSQSETETTVVDQTLGSFTNLLRIFDRMKELGIYEDAAIIITGDHGRAISDTKPIQKATRIGLFYKAPGSAGTPLVQSSAPVSTENIPATIVKAAGGNYATYGRPLDEIGEDEQLTRVTYKSVADSDTYREVERYTYHITGDAADFDNWEIVEITPIEYRFY